MIDRKSGTKIGKVSTAQRSSEQVQAVSQRTPSTQDVEAQRYSQNNDGEAHVVCQQESAAISGACGSGRRKCAVKTPSLRTARLPHPSMRSCIGGGVRRGNLAVCFLGSLHRECGAADDTSSLSLWWQ